MSTQEERNTPIYDFSNYLRALNFDFEIIKIDSKLNFDKNKNYLTQTLKQDSLKNSQTQQLNNFLSMSKYLENQDLKLEQNYYLIVFKNNNDKKLELSLLSYNQHLSLTLPTSEEIKKIVDKKIIPTNTTKSSLATLIKETSTYLKMDNNKFVSYLTVNQFPLTVNDMWLSNFSEIENVNISIRVRHLDNITAFKLLDRAIRRAQDQETKKASEDIEYSLYLQNFNELLQLIQVGGETLKMVSIIFTCFADSKKELDQVVSNLKNEMIRNRFTINDLTFRQFEIYKCLLFNNNDKLKNIEQEMAAITLASAWPFPSKPLNDPQGLIMGENEQLQPVIFDIKTKSSTRASHNAFIVGQMGFGKTFNVKKQLNWLYCNNTKIYIIDPQREYGSFANYHGGEIIEFGNNPKAKINPLEIFTDNFPEHISLLEQWFKNLYSDLTNIDLAKLQEYIIQLYKNFKITAATNLSKLTPKDYPILNDLYNLVYQKEKNTLLEKMLWKLTKGADGVLFNGVSTLEIKSDLIVFDIYNMAKSKTISNAQMYLLLALLDRVMKKNKEDNLNLPPEQQSWICIAIDEAHLLINEDNLLALNYLFTLSKTCRKFNGILYILTQSIGDFTQHGENVKRQARGIIEQCTYQFIHHLNSIGLQNYTELLTDNNMINAYEKNIILTPRKGLCLFSINDKRYILQFIATSEEIKAIGTQEDINNLGKKI
ncbi:VirB4 family type IV secretion system protein [Spiroplasma kunkelii]|uniref:VirB4 family type IV secretion system protein n=1 Tax=Spiroplasma kunkelii TaxID=47834 RepID=UPI0006A9D246|nr:ATP-binding protein [Spiroplasma kunkelii]